MTNDESVLHITTVNLFITFSREQNAFTRSCQFFTLRTAWWGFQQWDSVQYEYLARAANVRIFRCKIKSNRV